MRSNAKIAIAEIGTSVEGSAAAASQAEAVRPGLDRMADCAAQHIPGEIKS